MSSSLVHQPHEARSHGSPRQVAHDHAALVEARGVLDGLARRDERDERSAARLANDLEPLRERAARQRAAISADRARTATRARRRARRRGRRGTAATASPNRSGRRCPWARSCRPARSTSARSRSGSRRRARRGRGRRARRSGPDRRATSAPRRCRSRASPTSTGIAPTDWAPSTSTGRPVVRLSSCTGITWPVVQSTCESASKRVRGVTWDRISSSAFATGRAATSATRTVAPETCSGQQEARSARSRW